MKNMLPKAEFFCILYYSLYNCEVNYFCSVEKRF